MTAEVALLAAHLAGGLERIAWFNGRILTAEDMADHQRATDGADRRLGRSLGAGVVRGLVVRPRPDGRSVTVTQGLALDAAGEVLELSADVVVHLVRPPGLPATAPADFVCCDVTPTPARLAGTGAYLLTIASAAGTRGGAAGVGTTGTGSAACGPRYHVAGVQFRLVELDVEALAEAGGHDEADLAVLATVGAAARHPRLRNVLAHVLLDTRARLRTLVDPFGSTSVPALTRLADTGLVGCEVPLALLVWAAGRVEFVDVWAARRPPAPAGPLPWSAAAAAAGGGPVASDGPTPWPAHLVAPVDAQLGLVVLRQAADHLRDLAGPGSASAARITLEARDVFRYLPAALLVPHMGAAGALGVDLAVFLSGLDVRSDPALAAGRLWPLLAASLTAPVTDLDAAGVLRSYQVAESVSAGVGQPFVVLAADHLRHLALAPPQDDDRPVITAVSPPGDHEVGAEITVHGRGFLMPASTNAVTVGGVAVAAFNPGTSATALVLNVPDVPGVPRAAALTVTNENGSAEWLLAVVPRALVPQGEITFAEDFGELAGQVLEEGADVTFFWQVEAVTDIASTYAFTPVVTGATGVPASDWLAAAAVVDGAGQERTEFELRPADPDDVGSGPVRIGVRLTVPIGATTADLALRCRSGAAPDDPALNRTSSPVALVVGQETETSDPRIVFDPPDLTAGGSVDAEGRLVLPVGTPVRVAVTARFAEAATTRYDAQVVPATDVWTLSNPNPPPDRTVPESAGGEGRFAVTLVAGRPDTEPTRTLRVQVEATAADSGTTYVSFVRLRLRNP